MKLDITVKLKILMYICTISYFNAQSFTQYRN